MKRKGFTLIELLVVVAIIGILAAVGVVAYNGYTGAAKASASKTNYKNITKYIRAELMKCNTGIADTIFGKSCPITASQTFASGLNNSCRSGDLSKFKNPYNTAQNACRLNISYTNDSDVGYFNWSEKDGYNHRYSSCWKTPCSDANNREEIIINVTE